jgi:hypothetical protein
MTSIRENERPRNVLLPKHEDHLPPKQEDHLLPKQEDDLSPTQENCDAPRRAVAMSLAFLYH